MTDTAIIELYFIRSEQAIDESQASYGGYCYRVADGILRDPGDSEESVNDTWLAAWNAIPPTRPNCLKAYFGALTRRISVDRLRTVHHRDYVSLGGVTGSTEYQAAAEWLAFKGDYADRKTAEQTEQGQPYYEWRDLERSFAADEETREICRLYQVWDGTMWAKLQEIAARYGLALHTERQAIENAGDQSREHGAYEDGSFHISVSAVVEQKRYLYELYLEKNGCLPCDDMTAGAACEYEEWEYTTGRGDKVSIAVRDVSTSEAWAQYELLVFYSGDGAVMTVRASYGCQRGDGNEKLFAERLAGSIDFSAAAGADTPEEAVLILRGN